MLKKSIISKFLYFLPIILGLILLGFFLGIFFVTLLFLSNPLKNPLSQFEKISLITNFLLFFASISAVFFAYRTFLRQREQWLNESFIKHEAEVLLKLRGELQESLGAINFFFHNILQIDRKFSFNPLQLPVVANPPLVTYEKIAKEFNVLVDLNNLYNSCQHICRKYGLSQGMECISLLLESARSIPEENINFYKLSHSDTLIKYPVNPSLLAPDTLVVYEMDPRVANSIIGSFNFIAYSIFSKNCSSSFDLDALNEQNQKNQMDEFERFKSMTQNAIYKFVSDLDRITTYWGGVDNVDAMMNKRMRFFQKKNVF